MRKIIVLLSLLFSCFYTTAQILEPVKWSTSVNKISDTEFELVVKATMDDGWYLYSQTIPEGGPIATTFTYDDANGAFKIKGNTTEPKGKVKYTELFGDGGMEIKTFSGVANFKQQIEVLGEERILIAYVEFQTCDDEKCLMPQEVELSFNIDEAVAIDASEIGNNQSSSNTDVAESSEKASESKNNSGASESKKGLWGIFLIAFLSGFAALLTPCVFPMIPLTVSFFTKQSQNKAQGIRNAIFYGISIIVIYVLLGTAVTAIFGADALNALASNPWFNVIFFLILIIFAVSFLGAFEITLPQSWANKVDAQSNRSGLIGIFFMALALAIVSFSCTGPIVGTLLVEAASKGGTAPIIGMLGFSLAIAIPFALFAAFPGWMNSLPKSGGWLNTVKVVLGFLELALAFKFLSNADYVLQLHLFEREVFIAVWIAVFGTLTFYLFGKIQLPHDSPLTHISVGRLSLGLITLTFTIYMIPGLWGAPLNLISAFPPPHDYAESPYGVGYTRSGGSIGGHVEAIPEGAHLMAPHNIMAFKDYDKGLAYAKQVGKPVMIDFTGYTCVNCRKMEQNVWVKPKVLEILKNDVVLISLYVDDPKPLPEDEIREYTLKPGKYWKDYGDKWGDLQASRYNANTQPMYVLMDHNEENLNNPVAYTPNVDEYHAWLKDGISKFKN